MELYFLTSAPAIDLASVIFYVAAGLLLYTWLLYPALLAMLPARSSKVDHASGNAVQRFPFVSVVVSAYNEEDVIEAKIRRFLADTYPGKSELLIVSDGSTDKTAEIVSQFVSNRVLLFDESTRRGKGAALAVAVPRTRGEILVFTDATSVFAPQALTELVRPFRDNGVGLVTGRVQVEGCPIAGLYRRYEEVIEHFEQRGGVISTAHGCIYAMRRSLWCQHDPRLTNDFFHPIFVNLRGFDVAVAPEAICMEAYSPDPKVQFRRQVRMVALAAFVYFKYLPVLLYAGKWRSLFVLTSHKLMRWLTIPYLVLLGIAPAWLAGYGSIYTAALAAESLFVAAVVGGALIKRSDVHSRLTFVAEFVTLNWAGTLGFWRACRGHLPTVWETTNAPVSNSNLTRLGPIK
jgi:cellulose synthase/poly-beta-1,6-N-acetylglucosamine synthase-like glycosyltransferase